MTGYFDYYTPELDPALGMKEWSYGCMPSSKPLSSFEKCFCQKHQRTTRGLVVPEEC